jgi:hypothetical protein
MQADESKRAFYCLPSVVDAMNVVLVLPGRMWRRVVWQIPVLYRKLLYLRIVMKTRTAVSSDLVWYRTSYMTSPPESRSLHTHSRRNIKYHYVIRELTWVPSNIKARSCNRCCSGKAINVTETECAFVAFGVQHAMRMHHIGICDMLLSTFFEILLKMCDFLKKVI